MVALVMSSLVLAVITASSIKHSSVSKDDFGTLVLSLTSLPLHLYSNFTPRHSHLYISPTLHDYIKTQQEQSWCKHTHLCLSLLDTWIHADSPATKTSASILSWSTLTRLITIPVIPYFCKTSHITDLGTGLYDLQVSSMAFSTNWHTQTISVQPWPDLNPHSASTTTNYLHSSLNNLCKHLTNHF